MPDLDVVVVVVVADRQRTKVDSLVRFCQLRGAWLDPSVMHWRRLSLMKKQTVRNLYWKIPFGFPVRFPSQAL